MYFYFNTLLAFRSICCNVTLYKNNNKLQTRSTLNTDDRDHGVGKASC
jgi:hypothetical protein